MTDRGVVAVLDPRLVTARYGDFLRASLPPFWTTTDPEPGPCRPAPPGRGFLTGRLTSYGWLMRAP